MSDMIHPEDTIFLGHWFHLLTLVDKDVLQDYLRRHSQHLPTHKSDSACRSSIERPGHV
jgi:hypothetical protein